MQGDTQGRGFSGKLMHDENQSYTPPHPARVLLVPFLSAARNRFFPRGAFPWRTGAVALFGMSIVVALHLVTMKTLGYFHAQNELGVILSLKIFQMAWVILFAMLIFSSMVSAISTIFLSRDNEIVFAAPVAARDLFRMRYVTTTVYTSWMMVVFSLPVFAAYGRVFQAGWPYWPFMLLAIVSSATIATGVGVLATIVLVNLFPARRTKDIILYLSLLFAAFIYLIFRLLRPEDMVDPDRFGHFVEYLSSISTPAAPYLPAAWAANFLSRHLLDREVDGLLLALLALTPAVLIVLGEWAMERMFLSGYTKSVESFGGYRKFTGRLNPRSRWLWFPAKEAKVFLRDSSEWSQLFMLAALTVVYLYNFKLLPLERSPIQKEQIANVVSFLNIGLTGFLVTSLAARFVYPSVSAEGGAFWLIRSAPLSMRRFLLGKYLCYVVPFTGFTLLLIIASNELLGIEGPMWWISLAASLSITWTVVPMALFFGSLHADFKAESRAAMLGGMGAVLFLFTAAAFELLLIFGSARPAYRLVRKWLRAGSPAALDWLPLAAWFAGMFLVVLLLTVLCLRQAARRLEQG